MDRIKRIASQHPFKRELIRGVSFHHAGLDNKRRSVVEMLFREKYLQVTRQQLLDGVDFPFVGTFIVSSVEFSLCFGVTFMGIIQVMISLK